MVLLIKKKLIFHGYTSSFSSHVPLTSVYHTAVESEISENKKFKKIMRTKKCKNYLFIKYFA